MKLLPIWGLKKEGIKKRKDIMPTPI